MTPEIEKVALELRLWIKFRFGFVLPLHEVEEVITKTRKLLDDHDPRP